MTDTNLDLGLAGRTAIVTGASRGSTPLRRHGQPSEIVGAALYLASELASYTTGSVLVCDGGATA